MDELNYISLQTSSVGVRPQTGQLLPYSVTFENH